MSTPAMPSPAVVPNGVLIETSTVEHARNGLDGYTYVIRLKVGNGPGRTNPELLALAEALNSAVTSNAGFGSISQKLRALADKMDADVARVLLEKQESDARLHEQLGGTIPGSIKDAVQQAAARPGYAPAFQPQLDTGLGLDALGMTCGLTRHTGETDDLYRTRIMQAAGIP
jgi:hypothetical protein